jgi:hypothetical protein
MECICVLGSNNNEEYKEISKIQKDRIIMIPLGELEELFNYWKSYTSLIFTVTEEPEDIFNKE